MVLKCHLSESYFKFLVWSLKIGLFQLEKRKKKNVLNSDAADIYEIFLAALIVFRCLMTVVWLFFFCSGLCFTTLEKRVVTQQINASICCQAIC